jgi:hypothetical protein
MVWDFLPSIFLLALQSVIARNEVIFLMFRAMTGFSLPSGLKVILKPSVI